MPSNGQDQDPHPCDSPTPYSPTPCSPTNSVPFTSNLAPTPSLAPTTSLAPTRSLAVTGNQYEHVGSRAFPALLGSISSVQQMSILAAPPAAGLHETDVVVMSCWMNKVALQLDDVLVDGVHVLAEPVEAPGPVADMRSRQLGSPSARFQSLLIHARGRGTVPGFYEAMLTRYEPC